MNSKENERCSDGESPADLCPWASAGETGKHFPPPLNFELQLMLNRTVVLVYLILGIICTTKFDAKLKVPN